MLVEEVLTNEFKGALVKSQVETEERRVFKSCIVLYIKWWTA